MVVDAQNFEESRVVEVAAIEDKRVIERRFDGIEVWCAEMLPSVTDYRSIGALLHILTILPCSCRLGCGSF